VAIPAWHHSFLAVHPLSTTPTAPPADRRVPNWACPVLGICYGLQFMVHTLGGKVRARSKREYGHAEVEITNGSDSFKACPGNFQCGCRAATKPVELPPDFI